MSTPQVALSPLGFWSITPGPDKSTLFIFNLDTMTNPKTKATADRIGLDCDLMLQKHVADIEHHEGAHFLIIPSLVAAHLGLAHIGASYSFKLHHAEDIPVHMMRTPATATVSAPVSTPVPTQSASSSPVSTTATKPTSSPETASTSSVESTDDDTNATMEILFYVRWAVERWDDETKTWAQVRKCIPDHDTMTQGIMCHVLAKHKTTGKLYAALVCEHGMAKPVVGYQERGQTSVDATQKMLMDAFGIVVTAEQVEEQSFVVAEWEEKKSKILNQTASWLQWSNLLSVPAINQFGVRAIYLGEFDTLPSLEKKKKKTTASSSSSSLDQGEGSKWFDVVPLLMAGSLAPVITAGVKTSTTAPSTPSSSSASRSFSCLAPGSLLDRASQPHLYYVRLHVRVSESEDDAAMVEITVVPSLASTTAIAAGPEITFSYFHLCILAHAVQQLCGRVYDSIALAVGEEGRVLPPPDLRGSRYFAEIHTRFFEIDPWSLRRIEASIGKP